MVEQPTITPNLYLFSYGMLVNEGIMRQIDRHVTCLGVGNLLGYKISFGRFAEIKEDPRAYTPGVVWELSDYDMLETFDDIENVPHLYQREGRIIDLDQGSLVNAWTYLPVESQYHNGTPSRHYLLDIYDGYEQHNIVTDGLIKAIKEIGIDL